MLEEVDCLKLVQILKSIRNNRKRTSDRRSQDSLYNERGILLSVGKDVCDCLDESCCGCFFPCPKCRSTKCGHECRQRRKYIYEYHEIVGTEIVIKNRSVLPS